MRKPNILTPKPNGNPEHPLKKSLLNRLRTGVKRAKTIVPCVLDIWPIRLTHPENFRVSVHRGFAVVLSALAIGLSVSGQAVQSNWEPNRYEIKCTHADCLTGLYPAITRNLIEIVGKYKSDGWPAHPALGPVTGTGAAARLIVNDTSEDKWAWTTNICQPVSSKIQFGKNTQEIANRPHFLYYFFAHEIFHTTQRTYPAFNTCDEKRNGWVSESLATAVGMDYARQSHPTWFPIQNQTGVDRDVMEREVLSDAGGRGYYLPLNLQEFNEDGTENNTAVVRYYRTGGLWRHIAEVYHAGSYKFVQKYLERKAIRNDWLDWTHKNVEADTKAPLARVFALYMADVANWWGKGRPAGQTVDRPAMIFSEAEWHKTLYDGCLKYTISPTNPKQRVDIVMQRSSARCIQITTEGLNPAERVAINVGVFSPQHKVNALDALQLSLASSTDKVGLDCSVALRSKDDKERLIARDKCVFGFATGAIVMDGKPQMGRVWDVVPQETSGGNTFTNTYILSRMAANPTDDAKGDGDEQLKISAVFVLDHPDAMINNIKLGFGSNTIVSRFNGSNTSYVPAMFAPDGSSAKTKSQNLRPVRIVGHLNGSPANYAQETVPRFGQDGRQAIATVTPGAVAPSVPVLDIFNSMSVPGMAGGNPANAGGIWMMRFSAVDVEEDGMYQQSLVERDYIMAFPLDSSGENLRPLKIGDSGQFKASVTALTRSRSLNTEAPATLTIMEYSPFVLRLRIEGTLCDTGPSLKRKECVDPTPFTANMVKAFAGFHDPGMRFVVEDTPATQQYARFRQALFSDAFSQTGTDTPMPPDFEDGPSKVGAVMAGDCTCSCDDVPYLDRLHKHLESGQKLSKTVTKKLQERMRCMVRCTPHYIKCNRK